MDFLVIADDKPFRDGTCRVIEGEGHYAQPAGSGTAGLALLEHSRFDGVLLDVTVGGGSGLDLLRQLARAHTRLPVVVFANESNMKTAVEAMHLGAADFLEKPFAPEHFRSVLNHTQRYKRMRRRSPGSRLSPRPAQLKPPASLPGFASPAMQPIKEMLSWAADASTPMLITGESGAGKTMLASVVHEQGHLAGKPFVTVSCAGLSAELLDCELFGFADGWVVGTLADHQGKIRAAEGGTLFLDEIGHLPMETQSKLLRLLRDREYERIGETSAQAACVRIITATHCDLKKRVAEGAFREDLYSLLAAFTVEVPPLRARQGDLAAMANHFLRQFCAESGRKVRKFTRKAVSRLESYSWPGNLHELRNAVQRAVILARTEEIEAGYLFMDTGSHDTDYLPHQAGDRLRLKPHREENQAGGAASKRSAGSHVRAILPEHDFLRTRLSAPRKDSRATVG
jgi:NtrC-family two-component system response regulator AlgB